MHQCCLPIQPCLKWQQRQEHPQCLCGTLKQQALLRVHECSLWAADAKGSCIKQLGRLQEDSKLHREVSEELQAVFIRHCSQ